MTINARAIEDRGHLRRHLRTRKDRPRFIDGGIRSGGPHELNSKKENYQDNKEPFGDSPQHFHRRCSALSDIGHLLRMIITSLSSRLATTMSALPSPFKSPSATHSG